VSFLKLITRCMKSILIRLFNGCFRWSSWAKHQTNLKKEQKEQILLNPKVDLVAKQFFNKLNICNNESKQVW